MTVTRFWVLAGALASAVLVITLLATWPLRGALQDAGFAGLSAERVEGTVWQGRLINARWRKLDLGQVDMRVSALGLLSGRMQTDVVVPRHGLAARIIQTGEDIRVEGLTGDITLARLGAGLPGVLRLQGVDATFQAGSCVSASGGASSDAASLMLARYGLQAPELTGQVRCRDGDLLIPLEGTGGGLGVTANLALQADGVWRLDMGVRLDDPGLAELLSTQIRAAGTGAGGFQPGADGLTLSVEGGL